ncbi:MAG: hypothetical protein GEU99_20130 [Luteitalea sp.]|nr:hypothetical protein [Luteitalea sp.]
MRSIHPLAALLTVIAAVLPEASAPIESAEVFQEVSGSVGLRFDHCTGATGEFFLPEIMGSGLALFDYDNDGDLDVYLLQGVRLEAARKRLRFPEQCRLPGGRLFRNDLEKGSLHFTDVTEGSGLGSETFEMGVAAGDYDNDGYTDLYVTGFGSNALYRNNGDGTFTDVTTQAGVDDERWGSSAAFLDYNHDGALDLFVVNYVDFTVRGNKSCRDAVGERDYCNPAVYDPQPDGLFRNEGNGRFTDVSHEAGIGGASGAGLGVAMGDFNGDGRIDVYVANDGTPNHLWLNQGDGTFREAGLISGSAYNRDAEPEAGMGVAIADFDRDSDEDIFVTNLTRESNTLYRNDGAADFTDVTLELGLGPGSIPYTAFGTAWLDYDNDGLLDLFVANGAVAIEEALRGQGYPYHQINMLFRQQLPGRFTRVGGETALELRTVSRGAAAGDIDNDGDVDILISNNNGPARLLLNRSGSRGHWITVRLEGRVSNREGLGSLVTIVAHGSPPWFQRVRSDGSYLASSDPRVHLGLGESTTVKEIRVCWPTGCCEVWENVETNRLVTLKESSGKRTKATTETGSSTRRGAPCGTHAEPAHSR